MLRSFSLLLVMIFAGAVHAADSLASDKVLPRGSKFDWARLRTSGVYWNRHSEGDPKLLVYIRRTTPLNVDSALHVVEAASVEELARYPFIYCDNIAYLSSPEARNLAEYLRRGGFLFIDACRNSTINHSIPKFLDDQLKVLSGQFPDLRSEVIPPGHEIFSIFFKMKEFPPYHTRPPSRPSFPMHVVFSGDRVIAIIGLNGFQCAWSSSEEEELGRRCAQMVTNIYVYAMTR